MVPLSRMPSAEKRQCRFTRGANVASRVAEAPQSLELTVRQPTRRAWREDGSASNRNLYRRDHAMIDNLKLALGGWIDRYGEWAIEIALIVLAIGLILIGWYLLIGRRDRGSAKRVMTPVMEPTPVTDPKPQQTGDTA
jgi:hypothetical protein